MVDIIASIIKNVLVALYQPFWFAVLLSVLIMFFLMYAEEKNSDITVGTKLLIMAWIKRFKSKSQFRRLFLLVFYITLILFKTLLSRAMHINPVTNVIGVWGLYKESDGKIVFTTEAFENVALFLPFTVLLLWTYREKILGEKVMLRRTLWQSTKITFLSSLVIEMLQLFLRLGTWQLSDLFYNTLGGIIGGMIYYIAYKIKHTKI